MRQDLIPISPPAVKPVAATEGFAVHEDTGLQIGGDEDDELPVHDHSYSVSGIFFCGSIL